MKKSIIVWMGALVLTIAGLSSCSNNDEGAEFHLRSFANSGCKQAGVDARSMTRGDSDYLVSWGNEYIEYKSLNNGYLSLNHVNTLLNCGAENIQILATISGNEIKIEETYQGLMANCICPFDLYCEVGPLTDGDYTVTVYQKYEGYGADERAHFSISYKSGLNGSIAIQPEI
jgi:hypothetical protein